jgi:hypothetical protein
MVIAQGGTHLLVPPESAHWLSDHPLLIDYFAGQHQLVDATRQTGFVFELRASKGVNLASEITTKEITRDSGVPHSAGQEVGQPSTSEKYLTHSPAFGVGLSSIDLDPRVSSIRRPTRPVFARHMTFEGHFDYFTLFYDLFEEPGRQTILAIGPPLPSDVDPIRDVKFVCASSGQHCYAAYVSPPTRWSTGFFRITPRSATSALAISFQGQQVIRPVQPNLSRLFAGRRVLIAKNKDNPLEWIVDWARYHAVHLGIDGILLYDNNSRRYSAADLRQALSLVPGLAVSVIMEWPFPYALPGVALWPTADGRWSDSGFLEISRRRFLSDASFVVHLDVDELFVQRSSRGVEDLIRNNDAAWFQVPSQDVIAYPHPGSDLPRHRDFHWTRRTTSMMRAKYFAVPARCPDDARWWIHLIQGAPSVSVDPMEFRVAHFRHLTTGWGGRGKRRDPIAINRDMHVEDTVLRDRMNEAFADWNPVVRAWDPLESTDPDLMRVAALEACERGENDRALQLLACATALDPYHPGQQALRRDLMNRRNAAILELEQSDQ